MRFMKFLAGAGLVALLAACGGGGGVGVGDSNPSTPSGSTATSITLSSSAASVSTATGAANSSVTITAEVRNSSGGRVLGEPITFTTDSGVLTNVSTTTSTGSATAVLAAGTDRTPRNITVTVTVGSVTNKIVVPVVSAASSIEVLSSAVSLPSGSDAAITITALVKNDANNGVANEPIKFSADSGVLQNATSVTNANGVATVTLAVGANKSQRNITVTATAGAISKTVVVPVSGTTVSIAGPSSLLLNGATNYTLSVKDSNGAAVSGVEVSLVSSLGNTISPSKATTAVNGTANFAYGAARSGPDVLSASGAGVTSQQTVIVNSENFAFTSTAIAPVSTKETQQLTVTYLKNGLPAQGETVYFSSTRGDASPVSQTNAKGEATTTVSSRTAGPATISAQLASSKTVTTTIVNYFAAEPNDITVQANAAAIPPNAAGTSANSAVLTAIVRDATGNPVQGASVNFTLVADTSGGTISPGTAVSNANGRVTASFIPGATTTAQKGVIIQASTNNGALTSKTTLTVSTQALFIAIATSNTISNKDGDDTVYQKPFSVQVNDAAGAPVVGQAVTFTIWPPTYRKGFMRWNVEAAQWVIFAVSQDCPNEDINRNGFIDGTEDSNGNGDGYLTPGIPGVISPSTVTTDNTGFAKFSLFYGEQYADWVDFEITAGATVAGTESRTTFNYFPAKGMASDYTNQNVAPASVISPFGGGNLDCKSPR